MLSEVSWYLMLTKALTGLTVLTLSLIVCSACGQTRNPASREELIHQIESYAEAHASTGTPMKDDSAVQLYHDNQAGLTPQDITQIYITKYRQIAEVKKPLLDRIPKWLYLLSLPLLGIFGKAFIIWIEERTKKLYEEVFQRNAGARIFQKKALRRYCESIIRQHQNFRIPFRNAPLKMREIYVPLKVADSPANAPIDALEGVRQYRRLMVTGNPGSGKSMLLRRLLLMYADGEFGLLADHPVPVLIELSRLNNSALSIEDQLTAVFDLYGFPKAKRFVLWALEKKALMLLLDGLDEVNVKERTRVVRMVNDLIRKYDCRAIITCRIQVYRDEFDNTVDRMFDIAEFTDKDIFSLLTGWESGMRQGQSVEHLMQTLRERPRILMLARNPLLLTMIAYLYADAQMALPYSRAEFYEKTTSLLLEKWQGDFNRFGVGAKIAVLSRLALNFQERPGNDLDRRSIEFQEVFRLIGGVLPGVSVKPEEAGDLLNEIIDRNGLMLRIDGGVKFQFTHLTLQEYFAARALADDRLSLLSRFQKDPDTWREVIKLWCGITQDATEMIYQIADIDEITATECLADARFIKPSVADAVTKRMRPLLGNSVDVTAQDARIKAFGLLAASPGPRGQETFEWLKIQLRAERKDCRAEAAKALAYSYRDDAAVLLAEEGSTEAQEALENMGDLAVRPLTAANNSASLIRIGTPKAIEGVVSLLWNQDLNVCTDAAWNLASKIGDARVETLLRNLHPPKPEPESLSAWGNVADSSFDWIWEPFREEKEGSSLQIIVGRIGYLLASAPRPDKIDPRLGVPLYVETRLSTFLQTLPNDMRERLLEQSQKVRPPTRDDWLRIFQPVGYRFSTSALFALPKLLFTGFLVTACVVMLRACLTHGLLRWSSLALLLFTTAEILVALVILTPDSEETPKEARSDRVLAGLFLLGIIYIKKEKTMALLCFLFGAWIPLAIYYCSSQILRSWSSVSIVVLWMALYCIGGISYFWGYRTERDAKNPLHGLLYYR